jgi:hypothetical protein
MIENERLEIMGEVAAVTCFKVLSQQSPARIEESR